MESIVLDQALSKIFSDDTELLRRNKNEYLQKVCAMSVNEHKQRIDILYSVLCEEVVEILYEIYELKNKAEANINTSSFYRRTNRAVEYIVEVLIEQGIRTDAIMEKYISNIFSIIGIGIQVGDKVNKGTKTYEIKVIVPSSASETQQKNLQGKSAQEIGELKRLKFPHQSDFRLSFYIILFVWVMCAGVSIIAMVFQLVNMIVQDPRNTRVEIQSLVFLINGGIITLLLVGADKILPLLKDSFDLSNKISGIHELGCDLSVEKFKIAINALNK